MWTCPKCGRTRRLPGNVVSQRCDCESSGPWMALTAEPARRGFVVPRLVEPAELPKTDEPPPKPPEVTAESVPPTAAIPAPETALPPPRKTESLPAEEKTGRADAPADPKAAAAAAPRDAGDSTRKSRRKRNRGKRRKPKSGGS